MALATVNSGVYHLLLLLHIVAVIVGFGGLFLNAAYTSKASRAGGREGAAITAANSEVSKLALYAMYSVPVWGIGLIGVSDKVYKFSAAWVSASFLLWFVAVGIVHGLIVPTQRKLNVVLSGGTNGAGSTAVADVSALNGRLAFAGGTLNLLLVVVLILMIWKPGQ